VRFEDRRGGQEAGERPMNSNSFFLKCS
jgi:hypothetical protein